jgi:PAS domain-containing protein
MRITRSQSRGQKLSPAPLRRRREPRRPPTGGRSAQGVPIGLSSGAGRKLEPSQWLAFVAIGMIGLALVALIWTVASRTIDEQAVEVRARATQQLATVAFVLAREIQDEMQLIDQSLTIIEDAWKKDSDSVDLGAWRRQLLALTGVADDIFIADDRGIIVQGTLPQSVGQGFGTAYVTYPNGSLETFGPDGTRAGIGKSPAGEGIQARQFLTYVVRPLPRPRDWLLGASYRSEGITQLYAGAGLGQGGVTGLIALKRGGLQAIVGPAAQFAKMDISGSELIDQTRQNESGIWTGIAPIDKLPRIVAYRRVVGRDMAVIVGEGVDAADQPLTGLAESTNGLAILATLIVLTIVGILIWTVASARAVKQRLRTYERSEIDLRNARQELAMTRARTLLTEPEVGTLMSSPTDGVARLDGEQRLRSWNRRFAELAGVALDSALGCPFEDLLRRQAKAGLFGDAAEAAIAARLTILHTSGGSGLAAQTALGGAPITMYVRSVTDGGILILLTGPENLRLAALPALPGANEPETADEASEW